MHAHIYTYIRTHAVWDDTCMSEWACMYADEWSDKKAPYVCLCVCVWGVGTCTYTRMRACVFVYIVYTHSTCPWNNQEFLKSGLLFPALGLWFWSRRPWTILELEVLAWKASGNPRMLLRTSSAASMNDEPRRLDFKPQSSKRNAPHPISKSFNLKTRGRECSLEALPSSMPATGPSWARAPPKHEVQAGRSNNGACMHGWMDGQMGICSYVYVYVCVYIYMYSSICTQVYI